MLQTNNIHITVCPTDEVTRTLATLKASPATARAKARFILATDGADLEAEDMTTAETVACAYQDFPDHFGFFLPLAGITTVKQLRESSFDVRATSRLNRLCSILSGSTSFLFGNLYSRCEAAFWLALANYRNCTEIVFKGAGGGYEHVRNALSCEAVSLDND
jgi:hypothetical protein